MAAPLHGQVLLPRPQPGRIAGLEASLYQPPPICCLAPHLPECWVGPSFNASPLLSKASLVTNYPCMLLFLLFYKFINSKRL